mgnify:FL=1
MTSTRMTLLLCIQNKYWVVLNFTNVEPATGTMGRCVPDVLWGGHQAIIWIEVLYPSTGRYMVWYGTRYQVQQGSYRERPRMYHSQVLAFLLGDAGS